MKDCNSFYKKGIKLLLSLALLVNLVLLENNRADAVVIAFDSGTGTSVDPYVISTAVQLNEIRNNLSKHFVLAADIDLNPSAFSTGWTPIGTFTGSLRGKGHTISDVTIIGTMYSTGFFTHLSTTGIIADLTFINMNVSNPGYSTTAGVVANNEGTISNVKVIDSTIVGGAFTASITGSNIGTMTGNQVIRGSVTGGQTVGALLAQNSGTLEKSRAIDTYVTGNSDTGGLVGSNQSAGVINWSSYVSSLDSLSSAGGMGGLVNSNWGTITTSYVESVVGKTASGSIVGGLAAYNSGTIENSYAKATARGTSTVGGLVGMQTSTGYLKKSYASGTISTGTGGLIGQAEGEVSNSFWNTGTAGSAGYNSGTVTGSGTVGLSAGNIMKKASFLGAGWDFTNTWDIVEDVGTPTLVKALANLEVRVDNNEIPIYFFPYLQQYIINLPNGTESIQVLAAKANVTDNVYINSGAANVLDRTINLTGAQTTVNVQAYRGSQLTAYTVTLYKPYSSTLAAAITAANSMLAGAVQGSEGGQYAAADILTLMAAITAATTVSTNPAATQAQLDSAVAPLNAAVGTFQSSVIIDRSALLAAITAANSVLAGAVQGSGVGQFAAEDITALTTAIAAAVTVSTQVSATQTELNTATTTLDAAVATFQSSVVVDRSALLAAIAAANIVLSGSVQGNGAGQYAAGDITTMTTAIAAATTVNTQPAATQTELNTAVTTLNTAVSRFQSSVVVVDRNALLAAIAAASSVLAGAVQGSGVGEYSFGDMAALTTEIAAATAVSTKPAATQTELDAGAMTLNTAVTMFQNSKIVDRSVLLTTITAANNVLTGAVQGSGPGEYAAVDITALTAAIAAATTVSTKLTVTQTELDAEVTKLNAAVTIFQSSVVVVDRSVLTAAITAANNVLTGAVQGSGPGEYAAADITALTTAIAAATTASTKLAVTQTELDAEVTKLIAAVTIFQSSVVVVDRSVLTAAITAANNVLTGAVQGSGAGEYAAVDITALTTAIAAATTVSTKLTVTQTELDAEVTTLNVAVTTFQNSMVGAVLLFAEETLSGEHHILVLTFNHPLQAIANSSEFSLSNVTTTIVSAELDSQNSSKVRLLLSEALPASGEVTITASSSAVIFNDRTNTALSSMYVLLIGDIVQLREGLLSSHDSSNGKIQISNITQYMKDHFATMEKHGITEKTFVQFFLQQVDPYFLPASPSGG